MARCITLPPLFTLVPPSRAPKLLLAVDTTALGSFFATLYLQWQGVELRLHASTQQSGMLQPAVTTQQDFACIAHSVFKNLDAA